jgi:hypothetical protein
MADGKAGRPFKYQDSYPDKIVEMMRGGALNCDLWAELDVCKDTFYEWIRTYPDFEDAYRRGRAKAESYWARQLKEMTIAKDDKGCKACIMILNNNFGWGKGDGQAGSQTINIGNMNVLQNNKTDQELIELIQEKMQSLRLIDIKPIEYIEHEPAKPDDSDQ